MEDNLISGFQIGYVHGQWLVTSGIARELRNNKIYEYRLNKACHLIAKQKSEVQFVYLSTKSVPPNPIFFVSGQEPEWVEEQKLWRYKGHRCIGMIPPKGIYPLEMDKDGNICHFNRYN